MQFFPAVDILGGRAVRLKKGDYEQVTVYNENPVEQARAFEAAGAEWLHIVDLDGAKSGNPDNVDVIADILRNTSLHIEVGGGVRSMEAAERILDAGADRVIFGTVLVKDPDFAQKAIEAFGPDAVVAGLDVNKGVVMVEGWLEGGADGPHTMAQHLAGLGYKHLICTDISRDGMQTGISPELYVDMYKAFKSPVVVSGGISSLEDIYALADISEMVEGVIAGRAIYEGAFDVAAGVAACKSVGA